MIHPRWELRHTADPLDCRLGFFSKKSSSSSTSYNETLSNSNNQDKRNAVQDGVGVSGDGSTANVNISNNDPDAVKAMAAAGADIIKNAGGAIVELNRDSLQSSGKSFDKLVASGASLVDKLIDANSKTTERVVSSFKPTDGANADVAKYAVIAAAVVGVVILMKGAK